MKFGCIFLALSCLTSTLHAAEEKAEPEVPKPKPRSAMLSFADVGALEFDPPEEGCVIRYTLDGSDPVSKSPAVCAPIRVASTLKLKAACFKPGKSSDGKSSAMVSSAVVEVECTRTPPAGNAPPAKPSAAINIDFSETPDLKDWALRAQKDADDYYPVICEKLGSDGFAPPRQILFHFKKEPKGIAWTTGSKITFVEAWILANPKDTGTVIHELAHVIQAYKGKVPFWLTEGIADYVRWENWEPPERRRRVDPLRAKHTNGYSDSAAFLAFVEKTYDKDLVRKLNEQARKGTYKDELFTTYTKKDIPALWKEFTDSLTAKPAPNAKDSAKDSSKEKEKGAAKDKDDAKPAAKDGAGK